MVHASPQTQTTHPERGWEAYVVAFDDWLVKRVGVIMKKARLRPEPEQVREMVQDVYCRLLEGGPSRLERLGHLTVCEVLTYLTRVAQSTVFDQVRAARAAKRCGIRRLRSCRHGRVRAERFADPTPGPELRLLQAERRRLAVRRLRSLTGSTDRDLRILWLALAEGWPSRELGRAFALQPRSVDNVLLRLRRQLVDRTLDLRRRREI